MAMGAAVPKRVCDRPNGRRHSERMSTAQDPPQIFARHYEANIGG
jgi:hypothetical protein